MTKREKAIIADVIAMLENHDKQVEPYTLMAFRKFTYENHEFQSCYVCGHSDKALIYQLRKILK